MTLLATGSVWGSEVLVMVADLWIAAGLPVTRVCAPTAPEPVRVASESRFPFPPKSH
jgi:hypothetical protein